MRKAKEMLVLLMAVLLLTTGAKVNVSAVEATDVTEDEIAVVVTDDVEAISVEEKNEEDTSEDSVEADDAYPDLSKFTFDSTGTIISGYEGTIDPEKPFVIPESYTKVGTSYVIIGIDSYAFKNKIDLKEVVLPGSIKTVGDSAFYGCINLEKINLGKVEEIGSSSFSLCSSLTDITIPKTLKKIGTSNFGSVIKAEFESGMTAIPAGCFKAAPALEEIVIPDTVKEIGTDAFNGCVKLNAVDLNKVTTLGNYAFKGCTSLTDITIPSSVVTVGDSAFASVKKATFANGTVKIPDDIFKSVTSLVEVSIPNTVEKIGANAFKGCNLLQEVVLPESVESIDEYAFYECKKLANINLDKVTSIGKYAFGYCTSLKSVKIAPDANVAAYAFYYCSNLESVEIGDNAVIESGAFSGCSNIKRLAVGKDVTFDPKEFQNLSLSGTFGTNITWKIDGKLRQLSIEGTGDMPEALVPTDVPWYGSGFLYETIKLDERITSLSDYAFKDSYNVESIVLGKELKKIGKEAFAGAAKLRYIEIPSKVISIGTKAFDECTDLQTIVFSGDAPTLGNAFIPNVSGLTAYYPETGSGWTDRIFNKYDKVTWLEWDNTVSSHDVVLVLDKSGSMSGSKIESLKNATTSFIYGVGGRIHNTRISIVEYDSNARLSCDFTTDVEELAATVNRLTAGGNTGYCNALSRAEETLENSSADMKTIIMFSDGAPTDGDSGYNNIYTLADRLRAKYNIFTVGFIDTTGYSEYREILQTIAGRDDRYFEANDVDALVQAFLDLIVDINKKDETTVEIKRHNERIDILSTEEKFCMKSKEQISIIVTPGNLRGDVRRIAIVQDGKTILSNATGLFENIVPGDLFVKNQEVYADLYNGAGTLVETLDLGIVMCDSYEITYMLNDGTGKSYLVDEFIGGEEIDEPEQPTRDGYKFVGWYTSQSGTGLSFFSYQNYENRIKLEDDIILYAKWRRDGVSFDVDEDAYHFTNSSTYFTPSGLKRYEITPGDFAKLMASAGDNESTKAWLKDWLYEEWGGSCFGMSSSSLLIKNQDISISDFDPTAFTTADAELYANMYGSDDVGAVESMINFYQMRQIIGKVGEAMWDYGSNESNNIKKIIDKMEDCKEPVVLCIGLKFRPPYSGDGGHAVVAFDLKETATGYTFSVYDCSLGYTQDKVYKVDITKSGQTYTKSCDEWENGWNCDIKLESAVTIEDLKTEDILSAPELVVEGTDNSTEENDDFYEIFTNYSDFVISSKKGSATVTNGEASGSLNIECLGNIGEIGFNARYMFRVPELEAGDSYKIVQSGTQISYETNVSFSNSKKGFYDSIDSDKAGTITIKSTGAVKTEYASVAKQSIVATKENVTTPWYYISFEGENTGYDVEITDEVATIKALATGKIDLVVESDANSLEFKNLDINATGITISKGASDTECVIKSGSTEIAKKDFGYSVVFDTQLGNTVPTLKNVESGKTIDEPNDPRRPGFIFTGWYKEKECKNLWNFSYDTVDSDITLYAGWVLDSNYFVTVTFNMGGADRESIYVAKGNTFSESKCPVIDAAVTDKTWYMDAEYTNPWDFDSYEVTGDMKLYAKGLPYTVTFETNTSQKLPNKTVFGGMRVEEPVLSDREGYTLVGWYVDSKFSDEWKFKKDRVINNTTLYARWIKNERDTTDKDTKISIEIINPYGIKYTGGKLEPKIIVRESGKILRAGSDYKVTYANNVKLCDIENTTSKQNSWPRITVTGLGVYKSNKPINKYFSIYKRSLKECVDIVVPEGVAVKNRDAKQTLNVKVMSAAKQVVPASEYTVSYYTDKACKEQDAVDGITKAGTYYIVLEAKKDGKEYIGNFTDKTDPIPVKAVTQDKLLEKANITWNKSINVCSISGNQVYSKVVTTVKAGSIQYTTNGSSLAKFTDTFELTAVDESGKVYAKDKLGEVLASSGKKTFTIKPTRDNPAGFVGSKSFVVNVKGVAIKNSDFVLTYGSSKNIVKRNQDYTGYSMKPNIFSRLELDKDYTVRYFLGKTEVNQNGIINAGNYKAVITGINKYEGSISLPFTINQIDLTKAYHQQKTLTVNCSASVQYSVDGATPRITIGYDADGSASTYKKITLVEGVDYVVKYQNNKKISTYSKRATSVVTGKGNFKGTIKGDSKSVQSKINGNNVNALNFEVTRKNISYGSDMTFIIRQYTLVGRSKTPSALIAAYDCGKPIAKGNFNVSRYTSGDTCTITIEGRYDGMYTGRKTMTAPAELANVEDKNSGIDVSIKADSDVFYYTGEQIKPEVSIVKTNVSSDMSDCFDIVYAENTKVGTGTIYVRGKVEKGYCGERKITFKILPKWMKWLF